VHNALKTYAQVVNDTTVREATDILYASWNGEYTLHNDQNAKPMFVTSQKRYAFISNQSKKLILDLSFPPINLDDNTIGSVTITIDYDDDGNQDWSGSLMDDSTLNGQRHDELDISSGEFASRRGSLWAFSIYGYAFRFPIPPGTPSPGGFRAPTLEYSIAVQQVLEFTDSDNIFIDFSDFRSSVSPLLFGSPSLEYVSGTIELNSYEYNLTRAVYITDPVIPPEEEDGWLLLLVMDIILAIIVIAALVNRFYKRGRERVTWGK
jgi:hypothetical protein